jgi:CopG family transcriptional regulator, nickel-responsive regulator
MTDHALIRFGVSIGDPLLKKFDSLIDRKGYANRSEAIRDLIRNTIIESEYDSSHGSETAIGSITIVYNHHTREIGERLTDIAHQHHQLVISSMHVHLTHLSCLEVMVVKGTGDEIRRFADSVISIKGVKHGKLSMTGLVEE